MGILAHACAALTTEALAATIDFHLLHSRQAETRSSGSGTSSRSRWP